jgi:hypothetical protein
LKNKVFLSYFNSFLNLFGGSKKATNSRMSLHPSKPKKTSKPGVEAFGCHIPQSIINLAKDYIKHNKQWYIAVFPDETHFTTINAVAWLSGWGRQ